VDTLTGWLRDAQRFRRAYRLDRATGKVAARTDNFDGKLAGWVRRSLGRTFAIYLSNEVDVGRVVVLQQGRRRLVLDRPAEHYQVRVRRYFWIVRRLTVLSDGTRRFAVAGVYLWLVLGPILDITWDGLDEMAEDFLQTVAEIVSKPENRRGIPDVWSDR
jgi:hypothetical protein